MTPKLVDPRIEWFWRVTSGLVAAIIMFLVTDFLAGSKQIREFESRTVAREEAVAVMTPALETIKVSVEGLSVRLDSVATDVRELRNVQGREK